MRRIPGRRYLPLLAVTPVILLFLFRDILNVTSSNSVLYFIRDHNGFFSVSRDLSIENAGQLIFMLDANCLLSWLIQGESVARSKPVLDVTWDDRSGRGSIKQYRPDGTKLVVSFSRFDDGKDNGGGLFIGGDLAYGDYDRSPDGATSGMAYFDGSRWNHIWCAANEGFTPMSDISGRRKAFDPREWKYLSGRVLKKTTDEIIIESRHLLDAGRNRIAMKRLVSMKAGDDYLTLAIEFRNAGEQMLEYLFDYGDEPWVGRFNNSLGDIGWTERGPVKFEGFISPHENRFAGFWDYGNDAAGEPHEFTGYANYIRWASVHPTVVYFSNDFAICTEGKPLDSQNSRVINLAWMNQKLYPDESRRYTLVIGMAAINELTGLPISPEAGLDYPPFTYDMTQPGKDVEPGEKGLPASKP